MPNKEKPDESVIGTLVPPDPDPEPDPGYEVRLWSTWKLQALVKDLQPYVNGSLGPISPRHASTYLMALRELNRLWSAYLPRAVPPRPPEPDPDPEPEPEEVPDPEPSVVMRDRVLRQLDELRNRGL